MSIDHIGIAVSDFNKSKSWYTEALAPLGITMIMEVPYDGGAAGFGSDGKPYFWIGKGVVGESHAHVALATETREKVDAFYNAALAAGGTDNGAPGLRPHYHEHYYGAFVKDPDGHNIEAVCHRPE